MLSRKNWALNYFDHGFIPIPLCWTKNKKCACFKKHTAPKLIGKAPLVKYANVIVTREMVEGWFTDLPEANIGLLLKESDLVVVDCDSDEAVSEFERDWTNPDLVPSVKTGRGKHFYFRANPGTPLHRSIHKGKCGMIDIFSNGYIVAPPSVHMNGHSYTWSNPPKKTGLPVVPGWIERFLSAESEKRSDESVTGVKVEVSDTEKKAILAEFPSLNTVIKSIIVLGKNSPYYKQRGYTSPSEALHGMIIACYERGLTDNEVFSIFSNERYELSYKYRENKCSKRWLEGEMERAKKNIELRTRAKKNSRLTRTTTTNALNSFQPKSN